MLDKVTLETFEPLVGQTFKVHLPDATIVNFKLSDVEALPTGTRRRRNGPEPKRRPFSLFFTAEPRLAQAMYPMQHQALGSDPVLIFIVPVAEVDGGFEYEAVFT